MKLNTSQTIAAMTLGLLALGWQTGAQAQQRVIFGPRAEASAYSATHQGPNVIGSYVDNVNGTAVDGYIGNGGTAVSSGSATSATAAASANGGFSGTILHSDTAASADLLTGILKGTVNNTGPNTFGSPLGATTARLDDTFFFNNTTNGNLLVTFSYHFDGLITDPQGGNPSGVANLAFSCSYFYCYNSNNQAIRFASGPQNVADANMAAFFGANGVNYFAPNIYGPDFVGQSDNFFTQRNAGDGVSGVVDGLIQTSFYIPPGQTSLGFRGDLNLDCRGSSTCNFGHTGTFGFGDLPTGLSIASASGGLYNNFATPPVVIGPPPVNGVPETATWAMMILGMGMVGAGLRLRRRSPAVEAG